MPPFVRADITKPTRSTRGCPNFSRPFLAFYDVASTPVLSPFCSSLLTNVFHLYPFQLFFTTSCGAFGYSYGGLLSMSFTSLPSGF